MDPADLTHWVEAQLAQMTLFEWLGYAAAAFNIATFSMRTIIPLRISAIVTNCLFIAYGAVGGLHPILIMHLILLPVNCWRLYQITRLIRRVREAAQGDLSIEWLKPFMTRRHCRVGEELFHKGDAATEMFFIVSGRLLLPESGIELPAGDVVGELGLLAPDRRRTQSLRCVEEGDVLAIDYDRVRELYFQNPAFGFFFLRLTTARLFQNIARLEQELGARPPVDAPPQAQTT